MNFASSRWLLLQQWIALAASLVIHCRVCLAHFRSFTSVPLVKTDFSLDLTEAIMGDPFVRPGVAYAPHIEHLVLRHPGTGTRNTTKHEWLTSQHKDTLASIVSHHDHLLYLSLAENVSVGRLRQQLLDRMVQPCGPAPKKRARPGESETYRDEDPAGPDDPQQERTHQVEEK